MGWLGDRYGARELMLVAAIMIGGGTVLLGMIKELWQFYVVYGCSWARRGTPRSACCCR